MPEKRWARIFRRE